jgi:hypothetical protein
LTVGDVPRVTPPDLFTVRLFSTVLAAGISRSVVTGADPV